MRCRPHISYRFLLILVVAGCGCLPALGQTDTGRYRPPPVAEAPDDSVAVSNRFTAGFSAGAMDSGDLFRVRTQVPRTWLPPAGGSFTTDEFLVTLDVDAAFSLGGTMLLNHWLALRADLTHGRLDMTAEAREGEVVAIYTWDRLYLTLLGIEAEARLVRTRSYPFLTAGFGVTFADGAVSDAYDQTQFAGRFGGGYHHALGRRFGLRAEVRCSVQQLDFAGYQPPVAAGGQIPPGALEERGPQQVWQILLGLTVGF